MKCEDTHQNSKNDTIFHTKHITEEQQQQQQQHPHS